MSRVSVSFIGAGALASGLAVALRNVGCEVREIVSRDERRSRTRAATLARTVGATSVPAESAALNCDVLWIAVPDAAIAEVAAQLSSRDRLPRFILHASGALSSDVLAPLRRKGVQVASAHPMMTFVAGEAPDLRGVWFALEGDSGAVRESAKLANMLGAESFRIRAEDKVLYHAFGAMLSPMLVAELQAAETVGRAAGISAKQVRRVMAPIVLRTVQNLLRSGGQNSFSGPLARGDVRTVESHLKALKQLPEEREVYRELSQYALGSLPVKKAPEMRKVLKRK